MKGMSDSDRWLTLGLPLSSRMRLFLSSSSTRPGRSIGRRRYSFSATLNNKFPSGRRNGFFRFLSSSLWQSDVRSYSFTLSSSTPGKIKVNNHCKTSFQIRMIKVVSSNSNNCNNSNNRNNSNKTRRINKTRWQKLHLWILYLWKLQLRVSLNLT